jgi:acyl transferase domain-containing protein/short-subunit dehydrogenase/acyl carrier protein
MDAAHLRDWLSARVMAVTGAGAVATDQPFSALGLDSAKITALTAELEELLGRKIDPGQAFEHPTIDRLAAALTGSGATEQSPVLTGATTGWAGQGPAAPVAVVGLACRFPGAPDADAFWELLAAGRDAIREVPAGRWDATPPGVVRHGGFLPDLAGFDAPFFRVPAAEAARMDPQQRLLLEVAWEALEDAGTVPAQWRGSATGVYVGVSLSEYGGRQLADPAALGPYTATGGSLAVVAGRLAYLLDLRGPALSVDTACSSSLVATHLACTALRCGECDAAVVAGVNVLLDPELTVSLGQAGMLAPDGRCKAFDASADGYVRAEGCGAVVLKPLPAAVAAGDRVYAVIRGSAVNSDGAGNGLTAPNPAAQRAVLRSAYQAAAADPAEVSYVECHGTGTALGDPIEAGALGEVIGAGRAGRPACLIGSVKTNIGHLESAAGIAGLIKTCLALHHGTVPASLHLRTPNPRIQLADLGLRVAERPTGWPGRRLAGVSSFGFSGTNAHLVVEAAAEPSPGPACHADPDRLTVLPLSARTAEGLDRWRQAMAERLRRDCSSAADAAYTAALRRTHHRPYRLAVAGRPADLARLLAAAQAGPACGPEPPPVVFVFSGQGSQWAGMGRDLLRREPLFASTIRRCDEYAGLGWSIEAALAGTDPRDIDDTAVAQPVTVAVQVALGRLLGAYGVTPAAVVGHSVGEISAAVLAGLLSLEDGMRLAVLRGRAMAQPAGHGAMLSVGLPRAGAEAIAPDGVVVGAVNSPRSCVLSGDPAELAVLAGRLQADGVTVRDVGVRYAFHSPRMRDAARALAADLEREEHPQAGRAGVPMYSTVLARRVRAGDLTSAYWARGVRDAVDFAGAMAAVHADLAGAVALEVGGHPVLRGALRECVPGTEQAPRTGSPGGPAAAPGPGGGAPGASRPEVLHLLERGKDAAPLVLATLARLYTLGCDIRWATVFPDPGRVVSLPPYPWSHRPHWVDRPEAGPGAWSLLGREIEFAPDPGSRVWQSTLTAAPPAALADHRIGGAVLFPAAGYLELARAAAAEAGLSPVTVRDLVLHEPFVLGEARITVQTVLTAGESGQDAGVAVYGRGSGGGWTRYADARLAAAPPLPGGETPADVASAPLRCLAAAPAEWFYQMMADRGMQYGPAFQVLRDLWCTDGEALAVIAAAPAGPAAPGGPVAPGGPAAHSGIVALDGALQLIAVAVAGPAAGGTGGDAPGLALPIRVDAATFWAPPWAAARAYAAIREVGDAGLTADVWLTDAAERLSAHLAGVQVRWSRERAAGQAGDGPPVHRYDLTWIPAPPAPLACPSGPLRRTLVLPGGTGVAETLAVQITEAGGDVAVAPSGSDVVEWLLPRLDQPADVICLWGLDEHADLAALPAAAARLVRAVSFSGQAPRLYMATRGTQPAGDGAVSDPAGATIWGLLKSGLIENPALRVACVDLDPDAAPGDDARDLADAAATAAPDAAAAEAELAYRGGRRYVRRIVTAALPATARPGLRLDPGGAYVITGGTGALGRQTASRLAERGAGLIALVARGAAAAGPASPRMITIAADVTDRAALSAALDQVRGHGLPLRGVVHAAGCLDDGALLDLTGESLRRVLAAKADGARHLDELTAADPLDWFVMFSSAAGVLGSPGQAGYGAANAFLDALAHHRRGRGRPALSVDWGPWAQAGMAADAAARAETASQRVLRTGTSALDPAEALTCLEQLIADGGSQAVVLPFDLGNLLQFYPVPAGAAFFAELLATEAGTLKSVGVQSSARPNLMTAYVAPRSGVERRIAAIWQKSLGLEAIGVQDSFFELGGDSVFGNQILVEINRVLGVAIDPRSAFDDFTVARLAELAEADMLERLAQMSDEEAAGLLAGGADAGPPPRQSQYPTSPAR